MPNTLWEKFSWLSPDFQIQQDTGRKTIRIKGVAMRGNATSRNNRRYIDEELKRAARTFIDMPITINHDPKKEVGKVLWMEYDDDGVMEYVGDVWKQPYVDLLRSHSAEVKGVSIEADYLHNQCPDCGTKFYNEQDFKEHRRMEGKPVSTVEPHGMRGKALSLVLSPEVAGFPGTTVELMESMQKQFKGYEELIEMVISEQKEKENMSSKKQVVNEKQTGPPYEHKQATVAKEEAPKQANVKQEKPASYDNMEACIKDGHTEEECKGLLKQTDKPTDKQEDNVVETRTIVAKPAETVTLKETVTIGKLVFKETECTPFEQCIKDGGTPEECARKFKETKERNESDKMLIATINEIIDVVSKPIMLTLPEVKIPAPYNDKPIREALAAVPKDDVTWNERIDQMQKTIENRLTSIASEIVDVTNRWNSEIVKVTESIASIKPYDDKPIKEQAKLLAESDLSIKQAIIDIKPYDDKPIKEMILNIKIPEAYNDAALKEIIAKIPVYDDAPIKLLLTNELEKNHVEIASLKETVVNQKKEWDAGITLADKNNGELRKSLNEMKEVKDKELQEMKQKQKEAEDKKITETLKLEARVDNLEEKQQGTFKGKNKDLKPTSEVSTFHPYGK